MASDKKLGVWGKDKIIRDDRKYYAEDYYCVKCYREKKEIPAFAFWPIVDIDIPSFPYCEEHIKKFQIEAILNTLDDKWGNDENWAK